MSGHHLDKDTYQQLEEILSHIAPPDELAAKRAVLRWDHVAKPLKSLGILEDVVVRIAAMTGSDHVDIGKKALVIACSDNGIVEEGVTQTGKEVTAVVTEQMTHGRSSVCLMAQSAGVDVFPVDLGVASDIVSGTRYMLIDKKIARGTKNFAKEPAMTRQQAETAVLTGIELVGELKRRGYQIIATGEMGIGNTTTSSAVASVLLKEDPAVMTGRGAGLDDAGLNRKIRVIQEAITRYGDRMKDAMDVLACVGGFDLAGLAGVFLGGAVYKIPIVIDGFISETAALAAAYIHPGARDYMLASHVSAEPAGQRILDELGVKPIIHAGMCLGEGTGAVAVLPLFEMALCVYREMGTFGDLDIEEYKPLGGK